MPSASRAAAAPRASPQPKSTRTPGTDRQYDRSRNRGTASCWRQTHEERFQLRLAAFICNFKNDSNTRPRLNSGNGTVEQKYRIHHQPRMESRPNPKRRRQFHKKASRTDVPDISGQNGGPPFHFKLAAEFLALKMAPLRFRVSIFQWPRVHLPPLRRMLCAGRHTVKFTLLRQQRKE